MPYKLKQFKVELIQLKGHWKWILFVCPYPWESKKRFNQIYSSRSHSCVTNPSEGINLKWKNMNEQTMVGLLNCFLSFSCAFAEKTAAKRFINANKMSGTFASFQHFTKLKFYHVHVKQLHTSWNKNSLLERGGGGGGGECTEMFVHSLWFPGNILETMNNSFILIALYSLCLHNYQLTSIRPRLQGRHISPLDKMVQVEHTLV